MPRSIFPAFLLPASPFSIARRRRQSSSDSGSTASTAPTSPSATPGREAPYLGHHASYLRCARCAVDLCLTSAIVSRGFTGRWGRAYLVAAPSDHDPAYASFPFASSSAGKGYGIGGNGAELAALPNTHVHRPVPRQLVTGKHTVSDVSCAFCGSVLGWKYVAAEEDSQRYKVGKFILETKRVSVVADWEQPLGSGPSGIAEEADRPAPPDAIDSNTLAVSGLHKSTFAEDEDAAFDSQDEEECEDLFAGVWTPAAAARRRRSKRWEREREL